MEIIRTNMNRNDKREIYRLTKSKSEMVQTAPDGMSVPVAKWGLYNDPKEQKDGSMKDNVVLSFIDQSGVKYSTVSQTFIREFTDIVDIMGDEPFAIILIHGKTKAGKDFVSCELDCDYKA